MDNVLNVGAHICLPFYSSPDRDSYINHWNTFKHCTYGQRVECRSSHMPAFLQFPTQRLLYKPSQHINIVPMYNVWIV